MRTTRSDSEKKQKQTALTCFKGSDPASMLPVVWFGSDTK